MFYLSWYYFLCCCLRLRGKSFLSLVHVVAVLFFGDISEDGVLADEVQLDLGGGAVALLGEDQEGVVIHGLGVLVCSAFFVFIEAMNQQNGVGVLLDAAGLAEVRELRLGVVAIGVAVELGQGDDGDVEFLGGGLEGFADLGDFEGAGLAGGVAGPVHEL